MKGIVLAGGKSRRFGTDKALARVDGMPMLERAVNLLTELNLAPCVITNGFNDYAFLGCETERDVIAEQGPLGGIYTALTKFKNSPILVLTCDMPLVSKEMILFLMDSHCEGSEASVFKNTNGLFEPFPGIYNSCLQRVAEEEIRENRLSMQSFIGHLSKKQALSIDPTWDCFVNVNSKEDLRDALREEDE